MESKEEFDLNHYVERDSVIIDHIKKNRGESRNKLRLNRALRQEQSAIRGIIHGYLKKELDRGRTLYDICKTAFGEIDNRYLLITRLWRVLEKGGEK